MTAMHVAHMQHNQCWGIVVDCGEESECPYKCGLVVVVLASTQWLI